MSLRNALVLALVPGALLLAAACDPGWPPPDTTTTTTSSTTTTTPGPTPCATGSYNAFTGNEPCSLALPGFYVGTTGALAATPCELGTYQDQAGQASCVPAPIGFYVDVIAAASATACPALTTTAVTGSTSASDCVGIVPATLTFSNTQDSGGNFGFVDGAGLKPGATVTACGDQFGCLDSGLVVSAAGTVPHTGPLFPALPCKTNIYFTSTAANLTPITSNTANYPPGTPGCP